MKGDTVAGRGEHAVIERIRARVGPAPSGVEVGIGDDAAVIQPDRGTLTVATTDTLVEGIHFDLALGPPADAGHKALAANLSDLAAMGAAPRTVLLALSLPGTCPIADVDALLDGLLALAAHHRTALVGGDVTASPGPIVIGITALGSAKRRRLLTRDAARPGDVVWVSGTIGTAAAGLDALRAGGAATSGFPACVERCRRPEPRVALGVALGRNRAAHACVDLSDGLADGVRQIANASNVGIRIDAEALPIHSEARAWFEAAGVDPVTAALAGGDDYELAFTAPPRLTGRLRHVRRQIGDVALTPIGVVTKEKDVRFSRAGREEPLPAGFVHFGAVPAAQ